MELKERAGGACDGKVFVFVGVDCLCCVGKDEGVVTCSGCGGGAACFLQSSVFFFGDLGVIIVMAWQGARFSHIACCF